MFAPRRLTAFAIAAIVLMLPSLARAQGGGSTPDGNQPQAPGIIPVWNNGVSVDSPNGDFKLQIGGLIQADGRFAVDDPQRAVLDTFLLRRVRPILQGRVAKYFEFRLMPDFAGGTLVLFDAYIDTKFSNAARVRVGKDKTPIGLEQLYADYSLLFPERTLANNLVPNRDVGVQFQGAVAGGAISYDGAIFNGVPDNNNGDTDTSSGKELVGRVVVKLAGAGIALAGSNGREAGLLPSYKTTAQQTFFAYGPAAMATGIRTRVSPSAFFYRGPIGAFAEYMRSTQVVSKGTVTSDIANSAWEVTGSIVATGETATDRGVIPRHAFDPDNGQWGALQFAARVSSLTVDPRAFSLGFASTGTNRSAQAVGVAAIWYANAWVKHVLSVERTVFDHDVHAARKPEHAIVFRVQLNLQPSS